MKNIKRITGWPQLAYQWSKDVQLFLYIVLILSVFRVTLFVLFNDQLSSQVDASEFALAALTGLRFDAATATSWILLSLLLSLAVIWLPWARVVERVRYWQALTFATIGMVIIFCDIFFFQTYGEQYNQMVLGMFYDDQVAILLTIWKEYHPLIWIPLFIVLNVWLWRRLRAWLAIDWVSVTAVKNNYRYGYRRALAFFTVVGMLVLVAWMIRGSVPFNGTPLSLKHAYVTNDTFLNRIIPNPMITLRHAYKGYLDSGGELSSVWPGTIEEAVVAAGLANDGQNLAGADIDQLLMRQAAGVEHRPKHVFVLLMESYSGWTMMPLYAGGGFSEGLMSLAKEGVHFPNFLPITRSTTQSLNSLVTGMPYVGYYINHQPSSMKTYGTSIAKIFKDMGYKTRFFYGGYVGWQRVDVFIPSQGFDEIHGAGNMTAAKNANEWGVNDEYLFDYVYQQIDDDQPSFNFILSTTNHPPYDLDLAAKGYNVKQLPAAVTAGQQDAVSIMGHHWYSDREMSKFIRRMNDKLSDSLFAVTGDHSARINLNFADNGMFYHEIVPLVLFGPKVLPARPESLQTPGSHADIIPTLVELSAPAGFSYAALGDNLLIKDESAPSYGLEYVIARGGLSVIDSPARYYSAPGQTSLGLSESQLTSYERRVNAQRAIAWYRGKISQFLPSAESAH
ncbi:MAG: sulfatase-like hydrolase/transferase [Gammaproteobacteria bacterium]|nr:sulfatase-like hydrolase/transferase [Gammaproteobacteria bacterium]